MVSGGGGLGMDNVWGRGAFGDGERLGRGAPGNRVSLGMGNVWGRGSVSGWGMSEDGGKWTSEDKERLWTGNVWGWDSFYGWGRLCCMVVSVGQVNV